MSNKKSVSILEDELGQKSNEDVGLFPLLGDAL